MKNSNLNYTKYCINTKTYITNIKYWELPNRKRFYNWVDEHFSKYEAKTHKHVDTNMKTRC